VFIHGCFWHQHDGCKAARVPKSRQDFWVPKLKGNVERDERKKLLLESLGWTVETIWECQTRKAVDIKALADRILSAPRNV
jgi:DNA mismatch endonuclease (patch repair protein)